MDELAVLPDVVMQDVPEPAAIVAPPEKKSRKRKAPAAKPSEKTRLIQRYLENFDSTQEPPPTHAEVKRLSVATLRERLKCMEMKKSNALKPTGLAERVIGLVSTLLDFLAQTDDEIQTANANDDELKRAVQEELGSLATYLNNKVQIVSHLAINTGRVVLKKRRITNKDEQQTETGSAKPR